MTLTKNELEIMDVLWAAGEPLFRGQIINSCEEKSWKPTSIHILLNSLLRKGAIREAGFAKCGRTCGRVYAPSVSVEEYYASTLDRTKTRPDPVKFFAAASEKLELNEKDIQQCLGYLKAWKNANGGSGI